mmetsp:Transcript_88977/g.154305  ORF Transcript_88977/g.154305 Transcript_88977/m.154305 type:complete len:324 (+) Transcript_88977:483-1454(+)
MGATVREMMDISLIRMLSAGPEVSLKGSPTVSPVTVALCTSVPFPPNAFSISMYFLALSQAPPALDIFTASMNPDPMVPTSSPPSAGEPTRRPTPIGVNTARIPGATISPMEDLVEMRTHFSISGFTPGWPSSSPGISRNWRRTSWMIAAAAFWTDSIVRAANMKGSIAPTIVKDTTIGSSRLRSVAFRLARSKYDASRATDVSTADPMAKPLPVAAVVLPRASSASVRSRTSLGHSAISAIPPALSAMGPYASVARVTPRVDSIPTAAIAIPYELSRALQASRVATMMSVGGTQDSIPMPRPWMMTGAWPRIPAFAMDAVGA